MVGEKFREGYKRTEVGVIPEEWEVHKLGNLSYITKLAGFEYSKHFNSYKDGGEIIVIRGTNITNNKLDLKDVKTIPITTSRKLPRSQLNKGDLVFAYVGTIGPVYLITEDLKYHLGPNTSKITVNNNLDAKYLYIYFNSWLIKSEINEFVSVGAQPSLSMTKIRNFKIIIPEIQEQQKIAEVMYDVDNLIQSLEKLIDKKKKIRQGTMQQLLTGKKRLPGFSGEWETEKFDNIFIKIPNKKYQLNSLEYNDNGKYPIIDQGKTNIIGYSDNSDKVFQNKNKNVIVFGDHTRILKYINFDFIVGADGTQLLKVKNEKYNAKYFYYQLLTKEIPNTGYNRHFKFLKELFLYVPLTEEQHEISRIITDMDSEIETLEQKLEKYKKIKQGMMQELLTGRIRLI